MHFIRRLPSLTLMTWENGTDESWLPRRSRKNRRSRISSRGAEPPQRLRTRTPAHRPPPRSSRWAAGRAAVRAEEVIVAGDRYVVRWIYRKERDGKRWHLRGIDVLTVRDGKIAAKLAYVNG